MLKIQMLEQIVTSDSVADDDKQHNDAEQSTSRTPINLSPQRNGLVHANAFFILCLSLPYIFFVWFMLIHTHIWSIVLNNWYKKSHQNVIRTRWLCSRCWWCWWWRQNKRHVYASKRANARHNLTIMAPLILQFINKCWLHRCGVFLCLQHCVCHSEPCSFNYKNNCRTIAREENLIWTHRWWWWWWKHIRHFWQSNTEN